MIPGVYVSAHSHACILDTQFYRLSIADPDMYQMSQHGHHTRKATQNSPLSESDRGRLLLDFLFTGCCADNMGWVGGWRSGEMLVGGPLQRSVACALGL